MNKAEPEMETRNRQGPEGWESGIRVERVGTD